VPVWARLATALPTTLARMVEIIERAATGSYILEGLQL
jgi:hypothetical protein